MKLSPVKLLVPSWGEDYINSLTSLGLPSLLSSGNLPAACREREVVVVFLTRKQDMPLIDMAPASARLRQHAEVVFEPIDDIIVPGMAGLTLTRAYGRPILKDGKSAVGTIYFLFNSDFIASDGAMLRGIRLCEKHGAVLAPSLRANDTTRAAILDLLGDGRSSDTRTLVRLCLQNLHPTVITNFPDQELAHHTATHQLFWRIDHSAILGHFGLMFPLAFKPSVPMKTIQGFCDYSFIPLLCPDTPPFIVKDSDDVFLFEMQKAEHEITYLQFGKLDPARLCAGLQRWMTQLHREAFAQQVIVHSGDIPQNVKCMSAKAQSVVDALIAKLPATAQPYIGHPYWRGATSGIEGAPDLSSPDEKNQQPSRAHAPLQRLRKVYRILAGKPPLTLPFHVGHVDYQHISTSLLELQKDDPGSVLYLSEHYRDLDQWVTENFEKVQRMTILDVLEDRKLPVKPDAAFVYLHPEELTALARIKDYFLKHVSPNGTVVLAVHDRNWSATQLDLAMFKQLSQFADEEAAKISVRGGTLRMLVRDLMVRAATDLLNEGSLIRRAVALVKFSISDVMMFLLNVVPSAQREKSRNLSSIVIVYKNNSVADDETNCGLLLHGR